MVHPVHAAALPMLFKIDLLAKTATYSRGQHYTVLSISGPGVFLGLRVFSAARYLLRSLLYCKLLLMILK